MFRRAMAWRVTQCARVARHATWNILIDGIVSGGFVYTAWRQRPNLADSSLNEKSVCMRHQTAVKGALSHNYCPVLGQEQAL